jgi:hypothetical protein
MEVIISFLVGAVAMAAFVRFAPSTGKVGVIRAKIIWDKAPVVISGGGGPGSGELPK